MLRSDIQIEQEVPAECGNAAKEIEEPALKKLIVRIRSHEMYHAEVLVTF
jgi:rubrerythrin